MAWQSFVHRSLILMTSSILQHRHHHHDQYLHQWMGQRLRHDRPRTKLGRKLWSPRLGQAKALPIVTIALAKILCRSLEIRDWRSCWTSKRNGRPGLPPLFSASGQQHESAKPWPQTPSLKPQNP